MPGIEYQRRSNNGFFLDSNQQFYFLLRFFPTVNRRTCGRICGCESDQARTHLKKRNKKTKRQEKRDKQTKASRGQRPEANRLIKVKKRKREEANLLVGRGDPDFAEMRVCALAFGFWIGDDDFDPGQEFPRFQKADGVRRTFLNLEWRAGNEEYN